MLRPDTLALTVLLAALTAVAPLATDLYLPSMPAIARLFGATTGDVQLTISSYLVGFALGQIVYGPVSDRYGRKPVLLAALGVFCLASIACSLSPTIEILIVARFVQAVGASGSIVLARAVVRDLYSGARAGRELSLMGAIMALAPIVAPLAGGGVHTAFGWQANFILLVFIGIAAAAVVSRLLPETLRHRAPEPISAASMLRNYASFMRHRGFVAHMLIVAASFAGLYAWISAASFVMQDLYGMSPFAFGVAFATASLGYLLGTLIAARIVARIGIDATIGIGAAVLAGGGLASLVPLALGMESAAALVVPVSIYLAGMGMAMPQAMAGALSPFPKRAGTASSMLGFVQQTSAAVVGAAVGRALNHSELPLAIALALMGCAVLAVWATTRKARLRDLSQH